MQYQSKKINKLFCILLTLVLAFSFFSLSVSAHSKNNDEVIVGGCLFGVRMQTKGIPVVGVDKVDTQNGSFSPAYDAGIRLGDIITALNDSSATSTAQFVKTINECNGKSIKITLIRKGEQKTFLLTPILGKDGKYHAGIWIRDSAAGIGTVTYINPKTNEFAGLGHGICDGDTAALLPISRGVVTDVELGSVVKGQKGVPGELKGAFKGGKIGALTKNTMQGVYGIYSSLPQGVGEKMKIATMNEIKEGAATIRCSVSGVVHDYGIVIKKINCKNNAGKNFSIKVTDEALLSITGGIVQGMSGSPIIQNGKLIGAVTHVTINDPTEGYGIFIGNMIR